MTLDLHAVSGGYGADTVVRDVDLHVDRGEIVSVLGPSGSGKTTLLRMIAGLHPIASGRVVSGGRDITAVPAHRRRVGLVAQEGALFPGLTVAANIAYGLRGVPARRAAENPDVRRLLALVRLENLAHRMPHELSGGQRQRVAVARALAPQPTVVLLDEPFNALDAGLRAGVRESVLALLRDAGVAAVLITHDRAEAFASGDRVAAFHDGRVAQLATPAAIYRAPASPEVAALTGDLVPVPSALRKGHGGQVRPEQLVLDPSAAVRARVRAVRDEGARASVDVVLDGGGSLTVEVSGYATLPRVQESVGVAVRGPVLFGERES
ncbi:MULTISPECIES: ABC transporter ATP-binding protein [Microbacterium]|uniref:ABC transporter ATP-binding protein n=1 Tax=Microbacterium TaxID=33882 RepID=UPI0027861FDC|nr:MULTISPECIES: ABC transporter ATP-binding protein [Microbacterium]MDQ1083953.1 iron(III) transport system ATP-binding protein [Microbacterium sp. SORGH_AS_0344]MDQ1170768.1 iron(III) transport system ATP-binding protein [Microbacterium proteolyticum]